MISKQVEDGYALQRVEQDVSQDRQPDRPGVDVENREGEARQTGAQGAASTLVAVRQAEENRRHDNSHPQGHHLCEVPEHEATIDDFFDDTRRDRDANEMAQISSCMREEVDQVAQLIPLPVLLGVIHQPDPAP